jgi:hypothetical protein
MGPRGCVQDAGTGSRAGPTQEVGAGGRARESEWLGQSTDSSVGSTLNPGDELIGLSP